MQVIKTSQEVQLNVVVTVSAPIKNCFEYIVPIELSHIFHRYFVLPGVKSTDETEPWFKPDLSRTVYFTDGSRAEEHLLSVEPSKSFTYKITKFTGINRLLVSEILGAWQFSQCDDKTTKIEWTYSLVCRNAVTQLIVRAVVKPMLRRVLQRALRIIKQDLESR